jgi:hypothetical protein
MVDMGFTQYGGSEVLTCSDIDVPTPASGVIDPRSLLHLQHSFCLHRI